MLTLDHVTKRFRGGVTAVNDLSLELGAGVVGLLGPNGAGKTTLMQLIATITRPTDGQIHFQGVDILQEPETLRRQLGYLPQDFGVYDNLTAFEFLSYFGGLKGVTQPRPHRRVARTGEPPHRGAPPRRHLFRAACASGSASRRRCSTTRRSSSWTSRPPGSTPRSGSASVTSSPTWATASWCCSRPTSSRTSSRWPTRLP